MKRAPESGPVRERRGLQGTHLACQVHHGRRENGGLVHVTSRRRRSSRAPSLPCGSMRELVGDSARGADWACVRLRVSGERIVDADADGLAEPLAGLTLLEAAAVPGERLAADALANALGPAFRAAPSPGRTAV